MYTYESCLSVHESCLSIHESRLSIHESKLNTQDGGTALMLACQKDHVNIVALLLQHGAKPDLVDTVPYIIYTYPYCTGKERTLENSCRHDSCYIGDMTHVI